MNSCLKNSLLRFHNAANFLKAYYRPVFILVFLILTLITLLILKHQGALYHANKAEIKMLSQTLDDQLHLVFFLLPKDQVPDIKALHQAQEQLRRGLKTLVQLKAMLREHSDQTLLQEVSALEKASLLLQQQINALSKLVVKNQQQGKFLMLNQDDIKTMDRKLLQIQLQALVDEDQRRLFQPLDQVRGILQQAEVYADLLNTPSFSQSAHAGTLRQLYIKALDNGNAQLDALDSLISQQEPRLYHQLIQLSSHFTPLVQAQSTPSHSGQRTEILSVLDTIHSTDQSAASGQKKMQQIATQVAKLPTPIKFDSQLGFLLLILSTVLSFLVGKNLQNIAVTGLPESSAFIASHLASLASSYEDSFRKKLLMNKIKSHAAEMPTGATVVLADQTQVLSKDNETRLMPDN